jgi:hypothetical protein
VGVTLVTLKVSKLFLVTGLLADTHLAFSLLVCRMRNNNMTFVRKFSVAALGYGGN